MQLQWPLPLFAAGKLLSAEALAKALARQGNQDGGGYPGLRSLLSTEALAEVDGEGGCRRPRGAMVARLVAAEQCHWALAWRLTGDFPAPSHREDLSVIA